MNVDKINRIMAMDERDLRTDLPGRIPYRPIVEWNGEQWWLIGIYVDRWLVQRWRDQVEEVARVPKEDIIKPYLRPIDSMTKEESEELDNIANNSPVSNGYVNVNFPRGIMPLVIAVDHSMCDAIITWLNAHHFDYRGLIYKGLALEAPENMYNHCK